MQTNFLRSILVFLTAVASLASSTAAEIASQIPLHQLVVDRFGKLSLAEEKLVDAATDGKTADCTDMSGDAKNIRGDLLSWLCTNPQATAQLTYRGISITGAQVVNKVDLEWAKVGFPLRALQCDFKDPIILSNSHIASLSLEGSSVTDFTAIATHFDGGVCLGKGFRAQGPVNLLAATIEGNLDCDNGQFISKESAPSLNIHDAEVKNSVFLRNASAQGGVNLVRATIGGNLECDGSQLMSKAEDLSLNCGGAEVKGSVFLRNGFKADGAVSLASATIEGELNCAGGRFIGKCTSPALYASSAKVKNDVYLCNYFRPEGPVHFIAEGEVNLLAATIEGNLNCDDGQFIGKDTAPGLNIHDAEVRNNVFLRNANAQGGVNLAGATIDGNLECTGSEFVGNEKMPALNAYGVKVSGNVYLSRGFKAQGDIRFFGAYVGRAFRWFGVRSPEKVKLDLRQAKVGTLLNSEDSWPTQGKLYVDEFVYDQIDGRARPNDDIIEDRVRPTAEVQLRWLQLEPQDQFLPQPFEQLAGVLRKMGLEEGAKKVMIEKNETEAKHIPLRFNRIGDWTWFKIVGPRIGYGYRPWNAFLISLVVIGIGWQLFGRGYRRGIVTPADDSEYTVEKDGAHPSSDDYPKFNAFIYSLETFVPLVKLGLGDHWTPNANRGQSLRPGILRALRTGSLLRGYLWCHIIAGWVLTTLWVGGLTGLVKT